MKRHKKKINKFLLPRNKKKIQTPIFKKKFKNKYFHSIM